MATDPQVVVPGTTLDAALAYAARGWSVLPIRAGSKVPVTPHGVHEATTDEATIRGWWEKWPSAGVAIACGMASGGLVVVDVDSDVGEQALATLIAQHGALPPTREVKTARGRHLYFTAGGVVIRSQRLGVDLELRAEGLYVVAPPSRHPEGGHYELTRDGEAAPLPEWVAALAREKTQPVHAPALKISSNPPQLSERVKCLLETHAEFRERWNGSTEGLNDDTRSGRDWSLALIMLNAEIPDPEAAAALQLAPHNEEKKLTKHYLMQTISKAHAWLEEQKGDAEKAHAAEASAPPPQPESAPPSASLTPEQGRAILPEVLAESAGFLVSYLAVSDYQRDVLALWIVHTHTIQCFDRTPYLNISSPEKRTGKSLLLELVTLLVRSPWFTSNATSAALARKIATGVTALIDEADTFLIGEGERVEMLRGILNAGYGRGAKFSRCVGQGVALHVEDMDVFGPKAIAGLRELPDTIADRSLPIRMKRALRGEIRRRFYRREVEPIAAALRVRIESCAAALVPILKDARPERIEELNDRQVDITEPLLAIADLAGNGWSERTRGALKQLFSTERDEESIGVRLLSDVHDVFTETKMARIPMEKLLSQLHSRSDAPWSEFSRGKPLTGNVLARILRRFDVRPEKWKESGTTVRGYCATNFTDAWQRYLPVHPAEGAQTATSPPPMDSEAYEKESGGGVADQTAPTEAGGVNNDPGRDRTGTF